ncbi:hypothetical protein CAPTEDRAFT_121782 [Capitella teleta]|uniref:Cyclin N-terminal domain-containing protein n=1 Tax=Capitella teleta TaxID=283909 RepID=R7UA55_CAPTE|nr:hypothetical protein CAPTEDRAFT_121782 [Capitella teleta]|eukprot:ELU02981.1 hypothetical protein CAPTEDRAFT_121782 [Capitella teleta]
MHDKSYPPPNTPIKKRRLSKPRLSLIDTKPIELPKPHSQVNVNVIQYTTEASQKENWTTSTSNKKKCHEEDHAGFLEYETESYLHRRSIELKYLPVECLSNQPEAILVEWLTKLCRRFSFAQDTVFLTINILDRFLVTTPISRDIFQLLGITSLLVSAKREEQYPPEIADLLLLCDDTYTRDQVQQLERVILSRLRFNLMAPTAQFFLEHHSSYRMRSLITSDKEAFLRVRSLGRYLLELSLQDYSICQYAPSLLAMGVLEVSDEVVSRTPTGGVRSTGGYSLQALEECITELRLLATAFCQNGPDLSVIHEKYVNLYSTDDD